MPCTSSLGWQPGEGPPVFVWCPDARACPLCHVARQSAAGNDRGLESQPSPWRNHGPFRGKTAEAQGLETEFCQRLRQWQSGSLPINAMWRKWRVLGGIGFHVRGGYRLRAPPRTIVALRNELWLN